MDLKRKGLGPSIEHKRREDLKERSRYLCGEEKSDTGKGKTPYGGAVETKQKIKRKD